MPETPSIQPSRRDFAIATAGLTAAGWAALSSQAVAASDGSEPLILPGEVVLFQGDSITDAGRKRDEGDQPNHQPALGGGYAWMAAADVLVSRAEDNLKIFNRGISGNKVYQLAERWDVDCLNLKPNVLSILIGVNDIWHKLNGDYDGTVEKYEADYQALLARTTEALPGIKLIVCEPFVLKCGAVTANWFPAFGDYRAAAKRVAEGAGARFVPFQSMFDSAVEFAPPELWAKDGVHPSDFGNSLMAQAWLRAAGA